MLIMACRMYVLYYPIGQSWISILCARRVGWLKTKDAVLPYFPRSAREWLLSPQSNPKKALRGKTTQAGSRFISPSPSCLSLDNRKKALENKVKIDNSFSKVSCHPFHVLPCAWRLGKKKRWNSFPSSLLFFTLDLHSPCLETLKVVYILICCFIYVQ